ncbi:hypothetical protein ACSETR_04575 [Pseudomonas aeruginosa]|uniref:Uncharacterized protein n=1 Tax=Pseudomonas aeruginosa TaxID=287 RepID=A0A6A9JUU8_PSEAI|nr:hypothetical protein [Pseudomonas aeruginosa]MBG7461274.1 hypothetical protein [Pseudomonas aeruginosa]MBV5796776.1 hypothetical protein [Pseudomonas aeruginosa]MDG3711704.1 hypothetical protein [Pseudomonas aeruginosa]MDG3816250.1 hypothetical protein [Pseudomonas aeruginosa]MUI56827.1 hypothetical protein [Pseudomonas aeruginosa]
MSRTVPLLVLLILLGLFGTSYQMSLLHEQSRQLAALSLRQSQASGCLSAVTQLLP